MGGKGEEEVGMRSRRKLCLEGWAGNLSVEVLRESQGEIWDTETV
jgi:hypothetical protein